MDIVKINFEHRVNRPGQNFGAHLTFNFEGSLTMTWNSIKLSKVLHILFSYLSN